MIQWHFFDKVYRAWVVLCVGDADEFRGFLEECTYTGEFEDGNSGALIRLNGQNTTNGNNCYVLWLKKYETACLVHELTHLTMMVFDEKGVPIHNENTEGFAYYTEFWFNEILRVRLKLPGGRTALEAKRAAQTHS